MCINRPSNKLFVYLVRIFAPGVIFAVDPKNPGVPCVYRSAPARALNPERLNLDRRNLSNCPALSGEEELRLLNFENNAITKITNLTGLPNLIFLDLYNNQIREITGLDAIPSLRVLMLGKNSIRRVEGRISISHARFLLLPHSAGFHDVAFPLSTRIAG